MSDCNNNISQQKCTSTNSLLDVSAAVHNRKLFVVFDRNNVRHKVNVVWRNVFVMTVLHLVALYGWYLGIHYAKWQSVLWFFLFGNLGGLGILVGAHRLWTHRSFKAHWTARLVLMIMQTIALQVCHFFALLLGFVFGNLSALT